jgi:hypothetical protein
LYHADTKSGGTSAWSASSRRARRPTTRPCGEARRAGRSPARPAPVVGVLPGDAHGRLQ